MQWNGVEAAVLSTLQIDCQLMKYYATAESPKLWQVSLGLFEILLLCEGTASRSIRVCERIKSEPTLFTTACLSPHFSMLPEIPAEPV